MGAGGGLRRQPCSICRSGSILKFQDRRLESGRTKSSNSHPNDIEFGCRGDPKARFAIGRLTLFLLVESLLNEGLISYFSIRAIARLFKFNQRRITTLRTVLKSRVDIEKNVGGTKRQKLKHAKHEDLEKVLVEWFQQKKARSNNYPLSGGVIMEKAKEIASHLNITDFCGSTGWLDRFHNRHGIVYRQISGEAEAVNEDDISSWKNNVLPSLLQDYAPEDVYNADEFGLFFKLMPDKSFVFKNETCHGGKLSKENV
ncbi:tigger transposable element-derived protein 4 [Trichonephila clavipes]|nr:tigger transposable element-derived protein 4 [Trichonephila clavipes]